MILDFSDLNHYLNITTYQAAVDNTDTYVYALGDYGSGFASPLQIARQSPSLFKHYLWNKIFSSVGVVYLGDVFESEEFLNETISLKKGVVDIGSVLQETESQTFSDNYQTPADGTYFIDSSFDLSLLENEDRAYIVDTDKIVLKRNVK